MVRFSHNAGLQALNGLARVEDTLRVSLHLYNSASEVDRFLEVLNTFFAGEKRG